MRDRKEVNDAGEVRRELSFELIPVRFDVIDLPTITVVWRNLESGTSGVIPVPLGRMEVVGKFKDVADARLGGLPAGFNIRHKNTALIVGVVAVAVTIAAVLLTLLVLLFVRRFVLRATAPPTSPDVTALSALQQLEEDSELRVRSPDVFIVHVSNVLRGYLGGRFSFDALEATTTELLGWADAERPSGLSVLTLRQMLESMDMVKFAGQNSGPSRCLEQLNGVRTLVEKTRETAEQRAARRMEAEARIPSTSERLYAWSLDAFIGATAASVFFVLGGVNRNYWFLLTGALVLAFWMLLRDITQRSVGKRLTGLMVVRSGAARDDLYASLPPIYHRVIRNITFFPLPVPLVIAEGIASGMIPQRRRIGDLLCRTRVVREQPGGKEIPSGWIPALVLVTASLVVFLPVWALLTALGVI